MGALRRAARKAAADGQHRPVHDLVGVSYKEIVASGGFLGIGRKSELRRTEYKQLLPGVAGWRLLAITVKNEEWFAQSSTTQTKWRGYHRYLSRDIWLQPDGQLVDARVWFCRYFAHDRDPSSYDVTWELDRPSKPASMASMAYFEKTHQTGSKRRGGESTSFHTNAYQWKAGGQPFERVFAALRDLRSGRLGAPSGEVGWY